MNKITISFENFEKDIIEKMCEQKDEGGEILWLQYSRSKVIEREFTGVGFFSYFEIAEDVPHFPGRTDCFIGDVVASINGSDFDYGFVLFLKNGKISMLEGYTWADKWPDTVNTYELRHTYEIMPHQ